MQPVRCIQRGLESVKLEVAAGIAPPWHVQTLVRGSWFQNEWIDLVEGTDCRTQSIDNSTFHLTVWCLKPETRYTFRILPKAGDKDEDKALLSCECETLGKAVCEAPRCMRRLVDGLELHWSVKTPHQAPVLECQLQFCTADFLSMWQDVPSLDISVLDAKRLTSSESEYREETWQGIISKLKIATAYRFRVKARNNIGWSETSEPQLCHTSEAPGAPTELNLVARHPGKVEVEFEFADEEGCPVSHIEPEFCLKPESTTGAGILPGESGDGITNMFDLATWWWQTPEYFEVHVKEVREGEEKHEKREKAGARSGSITVGNLKSEQTIWLRLFAVNQAGRSMPSEALPCRSSERPGNVQDLRCTMRGATWVDLQWRTSDPEGAPVKDCCVEVSRANFIHSWVQVPQMQIQRLGQGLWQLKATDLEREADYHVRVKAANEVGWSMLEPVQISCRTAERPHKPRHLFCADLGTDFVKIEFKVASNFGQEEHISKVQVEESGMLLWAEVPPSRLEIEELAGTEVDGQTEDADLHDLGPFWNAELTFKSFAVVIRGLEPNSNYTWRIAVANEVGWSCEKSDHFESHTVYRPATPRLLEAQRGPFEIRVFWDQLDPVGGAINLWEAQVRESSLFSTWSPAKDFVILRQPCSDDAVSSETSTASTPFIVWEAGFGCLKPGVEHMLRLRTGNIAGWSDWSESLKVSTCGPPTINKCTVMQVPSSPDSGDWMVDILLEDNPCRAIICAVDFECDLCQPSGDGKSRVKYQTVARHTKHGNWQAHFPRLVKKGIRQKASATVTAGNAAGWSKASSVAFQDTKDAKDEPLTWAPKMMQAQLAPDATAAVAETLSCLKMFLSSEAEMLSDLQQEMASFLSIAKSYGRGPRQIQQLEHREAALVAAIETTGALQKLSEEHENSWLRSCVDRLKTKDSLLEKEAASRKASAAYATMWQDFWADGSLVTGLLLDVQLMLTGCLWLEDVRCQLEKLWTRLCDCAENQEASESQPARVVRLWAQKREAWAARFECQFVALTKQATMTAAQLMAVARNLPSSSHSEHLLRSALKTDDLAASNVAVSSFDSNFLSMLREQTMRDLSALKNLRVACDHQLRKLQRALELLAVAAQTTFSSSNSVAGGAHSFPEVSVTDKLSQTALGLLLTMVMPVPGSVEVGVASIGALWLEGDSAGKHLVVEHPLPEDLNELNPFSRFRQRARHSAEQLMRSWAASPAVPDSPTDEVSGQPPGPGQEETATLLVHNAASRIITVRILDRGRNIALRAYEKVQEAHPMVRLVSQALVRGFGAVSGNTWQAMPGVAIGPADLALLPLPAQEGSSYEIEFAYGLLDSSERPLGRVPARTGMAVSFVHLDDEIHVDNLQREEILVAADELPQASSPPSQPLTTLTSEEALPEVDGPSKDLVEPKCQHISYIRAANKDAASLTLRFFHLGSSLPAVSSTSGAGNLGRLFRQPVLVASLAPGEERDLTLEVGLRREGTEAEGDASDSEFFEVVAETSTSSTVCNVRDFQSISFEGGL